MRLCFSGSPASMIDVSEVDDQFFIQRSEQMKSTTVWRVKTAPRSSTPPLCASESIAVCVCSEWVKGHSSIRSKTGCLIAKVSASHVSVLSRPNRRLLPLGYIALFEAPPHSGSTGRMSDSLGDRVASPYLVFKRRQRRKGTPGRPATKRRILLEDSDASAWHLFPVPDIPFLLSLAPAAA